MKVFAAIDIGSNAARLLISEAHEYDGKVFFKKRSLVRVPLRLGEEVFEKGIIPPDKEEDVIRTMRAYKLLIDTHHTLAYKAVATSAMRDAKNGDEVVRRIKRESGIQLEVITGREEAEVLYSTHFEEHLNPSKSYLYIDVGGGSTEISLFQKWGIINTRSFNIGTIRLMNNLVTKNQWREMKSWVEIHSQAHQQIEAIGSGGNINKLYKLNGSRSDKTIRTRELNKLFDELQEYSMHERIVHLGMRSDRADVIIPATSIFVKLLEWADVKIIHVPKFGLSDGIIRMLYNETNGKNQSRDFNSSMAD